MQEPRSMTILISPSLLITGVHQNGRLLGVSGCSVTAKKVGSKVEAVSKEGQIWMYRLGENVRWMEVD